ncbi:MAG: hypothetical protein QM664_12280 [Flavihumibacter sp.]
MKAKAVTYLLLAGLATGVVACSKDDDTTTALRSSELVLTNDTSGVAKNAGTVMINELTDGNISMQVLLADSFRMAGDQYPASIVKYDSVLQRDSTYADLGIIDGATGTVTKSPVVWNGTSEPISYDTLATLTGFRVQVVTADSLVQAEADLN